MHRHCEERSDEAIQLRAQRAKKTAEPAALSDWIASLRSQ
jgi:hypothetical protein